LNNPSPADGLILNKGVPLPFLGKKFISTPGLDFKVFNIDSTVTDGFPRLDVLRACEGGLGTACEGGLGTACEGPGVAISKKVVSVSAG